MTIFLRRFFLAGSFLVFFSLFAQAQPVITAITNGADFSQTLAPGSIATIFGTGLANSTSSASTIPLPTMLANVTVSVNGRNAPLYYVSPTQINLQIPFEAVTSLDTVTVNVGSQASNAFSFNVQSSSLGIFLTPQNRAIVQNQDFSLNTAANPAAVGSTIIAYVTGLGVVTPSVADGAAAPNSPLSTLPSGTSITATIGDMNAPVSFLGLTPRFVGLAQANIQVPALPTGDYPLTISITGHQSVSGIVSVRGTGTGFAVTSPLSFVSNVSVPGGVVSAQSVNLNGPQAGALDVYKNDLYICGASSIGVVDISTITAPKVVSTFGSQDLGGIGTICSVDSVATTPFLSVVTGSGQMSSLIAYDLTNPAAPAKRSQFPLMLSVADQAFSANGVFLDEAYFSYDTSYLVQSTSGNLEAVNLTNLVAPSAYSILQANSTHPETNPLSVKQQLAVVSPNILYAAGTTSTGSQSNGVGALDVFDISNVASIQGITQIQIAQSKSSQGLAVSGTELLVVGQTTGLSSPGVRLANGLIDFPYTGNLVLTLFNITNPRAPVQQSSVVVSTLNPNGCGAVALSSTFFALACGAPDNTNTGPGQNGSLIIVDARNTSAPQAYTYATVSGLGSIAVSNGYLFVTTSSGANIYKITTP